MISLTTANPGDKTELIARAGDEFGSRDVSGALISSTPLSNRLGLRIALRGTDMVGGYTRNRASAVSYNTSDIVTAARNLHVGAPAKTDQARNRFPPDHARIDVRSPEQMAEVGSEERWLERPLLSHFEIQPLA